MSDVVSWLMNPIGNLLNLFNTSNDGGSSIWNHNNGYQGNSFTEQGNQYAGNFGLDPDGMVSGLWNDWMGFTSQSREFSQQEYLQDKMNWYNHPINQMSRVKSAGINANTAAAGIAQGGNESAQAPSVASNQGGVSQGVASAASALSGGAGAALAVAQRKQALSQSKLFDVQANETNELLTFRKNLFSAETAKAWSDAGMDSALANYWSTKAAWADQQERMDFFSKVYGLDRADKELKILDEEIKIKKNEVEISKQNLSQEEYRSRMMAVEAEAAERRRDILRKYGVDIDDSRDGMLIAAKDSGYLSFVTGAFSEGIYQDTFMTEQAQLDNLGQRYQVALQNRAVELVQDVEFQKSMAELGVKKDAMDTIIQTLLKYLFGTGFSINVGRVGMSNSAPPK